MDKHIEKTFGEKTASQNDNYGGTFAGNGDSDTPGKPILGTWAIRGLAAPIRY